MQGNAGTRDPASTGRSKRSTEEKDGTEGLCGIDEAGRGPIAGPVTAAAVILPSGFDRSPLTDSKRLSPPVRTRIALSLLYGRASIGVGWAWPEEIDRLNIHHAALLAMRRAFDELPDLPDMVRVDGKFVPDLPVPAEAVVKGDLTVPEISAASIIAKVVRDLWMARYARIEPAWGFEQHKGYPTELHLGRCAEYGLSPIHRRSFRIKGLDDPAFSDSSCSRRPSGTR
jgi:ribonuclease HII